MGYGLESVSFCETDADNAYHRMPSLDGHDRNKNITEMAKVRPRLRELAPN